MLDAEMAGEATSEKDICSDYLLIGKLKEITGRDNPDFRVVLPKRNPEQKGKESDYDKYND